MSVADTKNLQSNEKTMQLLGLIDTAFRLQDVEGLERDILPELTKTIGSSVYLFLQDPRLPAGCCFQYGFKPEVFAKIRNVYDEMFWCNSNQSDAEAMLALINHERVIPDDLSLYPLKIDGKFLGILGFAFDDSLTGIMPGTLEKFIFILANSIDRLLDWIEQKKQLSHLNTYLTVSSMLCQSINLHELLEIALYCCLEAVSAEAASVLILDDEKEFFEFYQVEGAAKPLLMEAGFPADKGLAGSILQLGHSEIINDVYQDPRFYQRVDAETGFYTRNMIAIPLLAGEEQVGVLEVINKTNGGDFLQEECILLESIADEIAFAIRNAKIFEYLANTYCRQRQGLMTCKGCQRPLGSWTPCVKYRERSI